MTPEYPDTDAAEIKRMLHDVNVRLDILGERLDRYVTPLNSLGENMQWLIQNVQGIFQMFASPTFMSQMSNMLMGGNPNARGPQDPGPSVGADSGTDRG